MPTPSMPPAAAADHEEPLLAPTPDRFCMFPIRYSQMWEMYKKAEASFWTAEEVDLSNDLFHWDSHVTAEERHFVTHLLAFFAAENHLLAAGRFNGFMKEVQVAEARAFYDFQISVENIHSEMFSLLLETYTRGDSDDEKTRLFSAIPCVVRKANWALGLQSFAERVAAFACVKGIFYSGSFCAVFWLSYKRGGLLPGLALSSKLISRDEELHCDFACHLYSLLNNKLSEDRIRAIVADAVEIERDFVTDALPVTLIGMNGELLSQYIEFVADRLLGQLGHGKLYGVSNPFDWMEGGTNKIFDNEVDIIIDNRKHPSGNHVFKFDEDF